METTEIIAITSTIVFSVGIVIFAFIYKARREKRQLKQLQAIADHFGHQVVKRKYRKNIFLPKVHQAVGQLDGYESRLYGYTVSSGNNQIQMTAFEMDIPFLQNLNLIIGKENILTKALRNVAGEGFVTRDEVFDDTFKIRTNQSLLVKELFLNEALREKLMEHEKSIKGRFIIKGDKLRYEEVVSLDNDEKRYRFHEIINLSRLLISELKLHLAMEDNPGGQIEIPDLEKQEEILPEILENEEDN